MNTDTPRTEVFVNALETEYESCDVYKNKILLIDFSRQLERELLAEQEKVKRLREALEKTTRYLADLNGCKWIKGDSAGEVDMRQRAKNLQGIAFTALKNSNETN